jgi:tetratricopeptide (TPR) repeat protein
MAELGKKLGKLSLAILENFVEGTLGKKFVDELRAPTDRQMAIAAALGETEALFISKFEDKVLSKAIFVDLKQADRPILKEAVGKFFDHPTDPSLRQALQNILFDEFQNIVAKERIDKAVDFYMKLLTKELMLADEGFRDNIAALMNYEGNLAEQRSAELLEQIAAGIVQQQGITQSVLRSLHQLPQPPADFTGREELIAQLLADFQRGKGATITGLIGMGGIGKTSLGLVVAHEVSKNYPDAQIFLDLKGTTEPLSAVDVMRHVILSFEPAIDLRTLDEISMANAYRSVLHGKRVLLFLDNVRSAEQIAPLRPPETCAMLVTSRWAFHVPGLHTRRLDLMSESDAETFLLELCSRAGNKAAELAKACGYLPLALRIAGSFLQVNEHWNVDEYLEAVSDRKKRLTTLHQSREEAELKTEPDLLATFELSYTGLSEEDRKRWRTLGVFPTSFDTDAARAMWELEENETGKLLGLLLRYSLLDYDETSSRYSLHDLLADYALSQMQAEEEGEARLKHAAYYKDVLSAADDLYMEGGEKILTGLRLFDLEWDNIRTGQAWATNGEDSQELTALCAAYPDAGIYVLTLRLYPGVQIKWLAAALSAARQSGDRRGEGRALGNLGIAYRNLGDARKAIEFYEQRLVIAREIGDRRGEGRALGNLGNAYYSLGDARKAIEFHEQALVIDREIGDRRGEGQDLGNLGSAYADLGDARKAIEFHEQALVIDRQIGDRRGEGQDLGNLGNAYSALGDARKAVEFYEQGLAIAREIGDRSGEGIALFNMGDELYGLEEKDRAIHLVKGALGIFEAIESPHAERARNALKQWGAM